jgi:hypothetical protein
MEIIEQEKEFGLLHGKELPKWLIEGDVPCKVPGEGIINVCKEIINGFHHAYHDPEHEAEE